MGADSPCFSALIGHLGALRAVLRAWALTGSYFQQEQEAAGTEGDSLWERQTKLVDNLELEADKVGTASDMAM